VCLTTARQMNVEIFNSYMHRNIRRPSRATSYREKSLGLTRHTYYRSSCSGDLSLRDSAAPSHRNEIFGGSLFETFTGNDQVKSLSRILSDKKVVKSSLHYMTKLKLAYDTARRQFMLQGSYSDGVIEHQGIVHSAMEVLKSLPESSFAVEFCLVRNIRIYSSTTINAIEFTLLDGSRRIIGEHDCKVPVPLSKELSAWNYAWPATSALHRQLLVRRKSLRLEISLYEENQWVGVWPYAPNNVCGSLRCPLREVSSPWILWMSNFDKAYCIQLFIGACHTAGCLP